MKRFLILTTLLYIATSCDITCKKCSDDKCLECIDRSLILENNKCVARVNCEKFNKDNICISCLQGYTLSGNDCVSKYAHL
jgi:hypothetical protein